MYLFISYKKTVKNLQNLLDNKPYLKEIQEKKIHVLVFVQEQYPFMHHALSI